MTVASPWGKQLSPISPSKESLPPLSLRVPIYRDEAISVENRIAPILDRLPVQEGIGLFVNDIPGVERVALARIGDRDYVPHHP